MRGSGLTGDQKLMFRNFSKYWCTFQLEKNKLSSKSWSWLTDAKTAIKKKYCPQSGGGGGVRTIEDMSSIYLFFKFDPLRDLLRLTSSFLSLLTGSREKNSVHIRHLLAIKNNQGFKGQSQIKNKKWYMYHLSVFLHIFIFLIFYCVFGISKPCSTYFFLKMAVSWIESRRGGKRLSRLLGAIGFYSTNHK